MKQMASPWVMVGPLFQPLRGVVFASVFYPLRGLLFGKKYGWLLMAWILIAIGILSTFGPASGSIEGMIYTTTPIRYQLRGWLEVVPQALLFSALLCYWVNHASKRWLNWMLGVVFCCDDGTTDSGVVGAKALVTRGLVVVQGQRPTERDRGSMHKIEVLRLRFVPNANLRSG
jgi:hypothetical protein